ncbi:MAG: choice-of-anchor E domain-containing protein [Planctomycetes bacterium]|nr:choice-of-anchor E domain-containing protein [Planctomycetota bacterium]
MPGIRIGRVSAFVLPCVLGLAGGAAADSLTHSVDLTLQTTTWTQVAPLPRFNPALGTLQGIEVVLDGHIEGTARFENRDPQPATIATDFSANLRLRRPDTQATLVNLNPTYHTSETVSAYDGVLDFGGTSGRTIAGIDANLNGGFVPTLPLNPVDQALFVGNGNILFTVNASGTSSATGSGNLVVNFQQRASARVTITYQYEPPFFPDCNHNGILDSTDVSSGSSTDCNANGLPDECEVVGEDCNDNGIPDACDFASGVLTDNDHDGIPDQCTCNTVERARGASLLVFPEYDNREGMLTLLTVTNTSCGIGGTPVQVEFVYIDSRNCLETNRTTSLSPCDTLTVVSSAHIGGDARGYAWAFAKSQRGLPISFNWLIGSALVLDGFEMLDYSMNAVAFKAIPQPDGALTDLDADGVRDLNAREYDPAPDVLLVPRFLGQLGGNAAGSLLVLVNLTGEPRSRPPSACRSSTTTRTRSSRSTPSSVGRSRRWARSTARSATPSCSARFTTRRRSWASARARRAGCASTASSRRRRRPRSLTRRSSRCSWSAARPTPSPTSRGSGARRRTETCSRSASSATRPREHRAVRGPSRANRANDTHERTRAPDRVGPTPASRAPSADRDHQVITMPFVVLKVAGGQKSAAELR